MALVGAGRPVLAALARAAAGRGGGGSGGLTSGPRRPGGHWGGGPGVAWRAFKVSEGWIGCPAPSLFLRLEVMLRWRLPRPPRPTLTASGKRGMQAGGGGTPQEGRRAPAFLARPRQRPFTLGLRHCRHSIAFGCSPLPALQAAGRRQQGGAGPAAAQLKTERRYSIATAIGEVRRCLCAIRGGWHPTACSCSCTAAGAPAAATATGRIGGETLSLLPASAACAAVAQDGLASDATGDPDIEAVCEALFRRRRQRPQGALSGTPLPAALAVAFSTRLAPGYCSRRLFVASIAAPACA